MDVGIKNKVVVVIGGESGIGEATTRLFVKAGATVVFAGRNAEKGKAIQEELRKEYNTDRVAFAPLDISKEDEVGKLAAYVKDQWGGCDVLFNNAGILLGTKIHETTTEDWQTVLNVNLTGYYYTSKYFIPQMMEKGGGSIINTSSVSGLYGDYDCCVYNTSKGAVTNMTRAMAIDYAKYNIRVNAVCPGSTRTSMYNACAESIGREKCEKIFSDTYPGHRIAEPVEIAKVVLFLASDLASFVNGVNLPVDGGLTAHTGQPRFMD
jgi:meso-butanediol dehydrogenase/(S,S)-butanediol dehydrogenase/diacetyl reductase